MRHMLTAGFTVLAFSPALWALDEPPDKSKTPRESYQSLFQEHQKAMETFMQAYQKATTATEKNKLYHESYPQPQKYVAKFIEIADSAPDDPAAIDALVWVVQNGGGSPDSEKAVNRLAEKYAGDKKVGDVAMRLAYSQSPSAEKLLNAILEKNPDRKAKGQACLAIAQKLKGRSEDKKAEAMFERAEKEFGDIDTGRGTIGKTAKAELYEIRNLGVGKPAPDITGEDIAGKPFKLSDYKGKVVVVDFWGDW